MLKNEKNTTTTNKKNSYTIHTVLTFISSLCAGGRICYCHSFLRTRVCDKSTSPDFTSFYFISPKLSAYSFDPKSPPLTLLGLHSC